VIHSNTDDDSMVQCYSGSSGTRTNQALNAGARHQIAAALQCIAPWRGGNWWWRRGALRLEQQLSCSSCPPDSEAERQGVGVQKRRISYATDAPTLFHTTTTGHPPMHAVVLPPHAAVSPFTPRSHALSSKINTCETAESYPHLRAPVYVHVNARRDGGARILLAQSVATCLIGAFFRWWVRVVAAW